MNTVEQLELIDSNSYGERRNRGPALFELLSQVVKYIYIKVVAGKVKTLSIAIISAVIKCQVHLENNGFRQKETKNEEDDNDSMHNRPFNGNSTHNFSRAH